MNKQMRNEISDFIYNGNLIVIEKLHNLKTGLFEHVLVSPDYDYSSLEEAQILIIYKKRNGEIVDYNIAKSHPVTGISNFTVIERLSVEQKKIKQLEQQIENAVYYMSEQQSTITHLKCDLTELQLQLSQYEQLTVSLQSYITLLEEQKSLS